MSTIVGALIFTDFELLDMFGPLQMLGALKRQEAAGLIQEAPEIRMIAQSPSPVASFQGPQCVVDEVISSDANYDILVITGGPGTGPGRKNKELVDWIDTQCDKSEQVATICTGSLLLAETGRLDGRKATTNKLMFSEQTPNYAKVNWVPKARWVEDGKFLTSSGVSAGIDMALALIAKMYGEETAKRSTTGAEYEWHRF